MDYYKKEMGDETGSMNSMEALRLMDDARRMAQTGYEMPMTMQKRMAKYGIEPAQFGRESRMERLDRRGNELLDDAIAAGMDGDFDKATRKAKRSDRKFRRLEKLKKKGYAKPGPKK